MQKRYTGHFLVSIVQTHSKLASTLITFKKYIFIFFLDNCVCKDLIDVAGNGNCNVNVSCAKCSPMCYITEESTCSDAVDSWIPCFTGDSYSVERISFDACKNEQ